MIIYKGKRYTSIRALIQRLQYEMAKAKTIDPVEVTR